MTEKRIGIVDHVLENFHANVYLDALRGPLVDRGYTVAGAYGTPGVGNEAWADEHGVEYFSSLAALNERVDYYLILAPSNPEQHLPMCQGVFPFGKTTFVDKTFAPDLRAARAIFDLADLHGVAVQSTSALRTTNVQAAARELNDSLQHLSVWAGGDSWEEYGVHPVELAVSCLGSEVTQLMRLGTMTQPVVVVTFSDDRLAVMDFHANRHVPFAASLITATETVHLAVEDSRLFVDAARAILDFFDAGRPIIPREETLAVRRILDAAMNSDAAGRWVSLEVEAPS